MRLIDVKDRFCFFRAPTGDVGYLRLRDWMEHQELPRVGSNRHWNVFGAKGQQLAGVVLTEGDPADYVDDHLRMLIFVTEGRSLDQAPPAPAEQTAMHPAALTNFAVETVGVFQGRLREGEVWKDALTAEEQHVYNGALRQLHAAFAAAPPIPVSEASPAY